MVNFFLMTMRMIIMMMMIMMISIPPPACEALPKREKGLQFREAARLAHSAPTLNFLGKFSDFR